SARREGDMAKHHQQPQQQSLPRPTAPLTPVQPKDETAEVRTWLALGRVEGGRHAVAYLKTQGTRVVESLLLNSRYGPMPCKDASMAEDTWEEASYPVLFLGQPPLTVKAETLTEGKALGLHRVGGKTLAVEVEVEGNRLLSEEGRALWAGSK